MVRVRKRVGFTLVELLVVIGIIALLIGILLPALNKARQAANETVCMSDFRQWGIGLQIYVDSNRGQLPQKGPDGSKSSGSNFFGDPASGVVGYDDPSLWFNAIPPLVNGKSYYQMLLLDYQGKEAAPHEGQHNIWICPTQAPPSSTVDIVNNGYFLLYGLDSTGTIKNSTGFYSARQFKFNLSYVFNSGLTTLGTTDVGPGIKMSSLRPTSEIIVMLEKISTAGEYRDAGVQKWCAANSANYNTNINASGYISNVAQSKANWKRFTARHRGGGMLLFADGHVAWFSWPSVQFTQSQLPFTSNSDANQPGRLRWSAVGPINSG